jgi:hypothetical protein
MIGITIAAGCGRADILCYTKMGTQETGRYWAVLPLALAAPDHYPQKIAGFSDRIMGENKEIGTMNVSF